MATFGGITFTGKSGEKYFFHAWPLETQFGSVAAVYYVTKRSFSNKTYRIASHEGIYIGQTANLTDPLAQIDRFRKLGANCICVHVLANEAQRQLVTRDMLSAHSTSCNDERFTDNV